MEPTDAIEITLNLILSNVELIKTIIGFFGVILTVLGASFIAYYARKAPNYTVKLEQLKYIGQLAKEKAWNSPSSYFVIEEAFRQYFRVFVPINMIKLICATDSRLYGFLAYAKVGRTTRWDEEEEKILVLSTNGTVWHVIGRIFLAILLLHIAAILGALAIYFISNEAFVNQFTKVFLSSVFGVFSALIFWGFLWAIMKAFDFPTDLARFKKELDGFIKSSEVNKSDIFVFIGSIIIIGAFWTALLILKS